MATVYIPTPLRSLTGGQARVEVPGKEVRDLVENLEARFPGLKEQLCEGNGRIRHHINVYVNGQEMRTLQGEATPLHEGDEVAFIPAMAGGEWSPRRVLLTYQSLSMVARSRWIARSNGLMTGSDDPCGAMMTNNT